MIKRPAWIFDVDGTLVDVSRIRYLVEGRTAAHRKTANFDAFHRASISEPPIREAFDLAITAAMTHDIIIVTARSEKWRGLTSMWLAMWGVPSTALFMRGEYDGRSDFEVKEEILADILRVWDVRHAVDDNPAILELWTAHGIPTTRIGTWEGVK